jgi:hypothetical protein
MMASTEPHSDQFHHDAPLPFLLNIAPGLIGTSQSFTTNYFNDYFDSYYYQSIGCEVGGGFFPSVTLPTPSDASEDESTPREIRQSPKPPQVSELPEAPQNSQQIDATLEKPTSMAEKSKSNDTIAIMRTQPQSNHVAIFKTRLSKKGTAKEIRRERNRKSVMKFRRNSKEWERQLEARKVVFETEHGILKAEYADLLRETLKLKHDIFRHTGCRDGRVDAWIHSEAKKFAGSLGAEQMSPENDVDP